MNVKDVILFAGVGTAVYLLWKTKETAKETVDKVASAIAKVYLKYLNPLPPAMELLGEVKFPGNLLVPLQTLHNQRAVFQGDNGAVFVKYSGYTWQLSPQVYGKWPATRVDVEIQR